MTPGQLAQIRRAVADGHLAFLAETFGPDAVDPADLERLRASGKIRDERLAQQDVLRAVHDAASGGGADDHTRAAAGVVRARVAQHARSLARRLDDLVDRAVVDAADQARRAGLFGGAPASRRAEAREIAGRVRAAAMQLRRDWFRVAHTELHNAAEEVRAAAAASSHPAGDPLVYKRPRPDACDFCRLLYLRPDGVTPRVFRLSALVANGTNAGRRAGRPTRSGRSRTEWRAVVGAAHPLCGCPLSVLQDGHGFDRRGRLVADVAGKSLLIEDGFDRAAADHVCGREMPRIEGTASCMLGRNPAPER